MSRHVVQFPMFGGQYDPALEDAHQPPVSQTAETLELTLAFEQIVDQVIAFQQLRGALPDGGPLSMVARARMREALVQQLNELDPIVRSAAEERCAANLSRSLPILNPTEREVVSALVADGLEDYRRGLRLVPLRGVGELR